MGRHGRTLGAPVLGGCGRMFPDLMAGGDASSVPTGRRLTPASTRGELGDHRRPRMASPGTCTQGPGAWVLKPLAMSRG